MMPGSLPPDPRADENVWPAARSEQRVWQPPSPKKQPPATPVSVPTVTANTATLNGTPPPVPAPLT